MSKIDKLERFVAFCKSKGLIFRTSDIYGGLSGFFDYGPLGVQLKRNLVSEYIREFVQSRENIVEQEGSIVSNPKVWEASGHLTNFNDFVAITTKGFRCRADHLVEDATGIACESLTCEQLWGLIQENGLKYQKDEIVKVETANLMFGSTLITGQEVYLRPETCQNIFCNAKYLADISRLQLPFGITQIGRVFRNEISPREFEQMEMEFFFNPKVECPHIDDFYCYPEILCKFAGTDSTDTASVINLKKLRGRIHGWHLYWICEFLKWLCYLGLKAKNLRLREHEPDELSHYSTSTFDIEYRFPFGVGHDYKELCGIANRTDYDITQHALASKKNLKFKCPETKEKLYPHVIEPSIGVERLFMAILSEAYEYNHERDYVILHLLPKLSPIQYAVFPLPSKEFPKEQFYEKGRKVFDTLVSKGYRVKYDQSGSIGRRYARHDETGTKWCITVDTQTIKDDTVTIRDRDSKDQCRVGYSEI